MSIQSWHVVLIIGVVLYASIIAANGLLIWHLVMSGQPAPSTKGRFFYCVAFGLQSSLMLVLGQYANRNRVHTVAVVAGCIATVLLTSYSLVVVGMWYGRESAMAAWLFWAVLLVSFGIGSFPPREAES